MLTSRRETKLCLFLVSILCLSMFSLGLGPLSTCLSLMFLAYSVSEWETIKSSITKLKKNNIFWIVIIMIIPTIVLWLHSPHLKGIAGLLKILTYEIVFKYFVLWIGFSFTLKTMNKSKIFNTFLYSLVVLTIFGIANWIIGGAPWINWLGNENYDMALKAEKERFHVYSLFSNSFQYGFISILSLAFFYYGHINHLISKNTWYFALFMCIFGILACGNRTNWACALLLSVWMIMVLPNIGKKAYFYIVTTSAFFLSYQFVPAVTERVDIFLGLFDNNSGIQGSSFEMREMQYGAVLSYISNDMAFGKGYHFFLTDLGWGQFYSGGRVDADLRGLEGVYLNYLLERGFFGYVTYLLFYLTLFWIILKSKGGKVERYMAIAVLLVYVSFAHMTGELNTAPIALFFIGLLYRQSIDNQKLASAVTPSKMATYSIKTKWKNS